MKPISRSTGQLVLTFASVVLAVASPAQEGSTALVPASAEPTVAVAPEIRYEVQATRTVPMGGRNLIIQRVAPPLLPAPPPAVIPPPLTPEQLAARAAARAARPAPLETRLLCLSVTRYAENLSYIEWWPFRGGEPFGAWSNADYDALRMVPEVEVAPANIRYLIFPFFIYNPRVRPGMGPVALPQLPADGPGFLVVKGDAADAENVNPVAALHQIYAEEGTELKAAWAEHERVRLEQEAWRAAHPPPPRGDAVIRMWPIKSQRYSTLPAAPATTTSAPAGQ